MNLDKEHPYEIRNSKFSLQAVKALIFDLDDTLYFIPSGEQFKHYGENLALFLPAGERDDFLKQLEASRNNGSVWKVGRAYDPHTTWILDFDHAWELKTAYASDGQEISPEKIQNYYRLGTHERDLGHLIHLASGWGIPTALGRVKGLTNQHYRQAYLITRAEMMKHPERFPLVHPAELQAFFESLKQNYILIVATNSDLEDANLVLERLHIRNCFHKIYGQAKKPSKSLALFQEIFGAFNVQYSEMLVIGDSVYNDLRDAKALGAQTVLIERFPDQPLGLVDVLVWDFDGFIELLRAV